MKKDWTFKPPWIFLYQAILLNSISYDFWLVWEWSESENSLSKQSTTSGIILIFSNLINFYQGHFFQKISEFIRHWFTVSSLGSFSFGLVTGGSDPTTQFYGNVSFSFNIKSSKSLSDPTIQWPHLMEVSKLCWVGDFRLVYLINRFNPLISLSLRLFRINRISIQIQIPLINISIMTITNINRSPPSYLALKLKIPKNASLLSWYNLNHSEPKVKTCIQSILWLNI